jgi:chaperonin GroES
VLDNCWSHFYNSSCFISLLIIGKVTPLTRAVEGIEKASFINCCLKEDYMAKKSMVTLDVKKLSPLAGYVLVEPSEAQKQTDSGIYLPDSHDEKPQTGTVLAIGGDWVTEQGATIKAPVKKGDTVIYKKWGGNEVKIGKVEYQFLKFEDILAIVK